MSDPVRELSVPRPRRPRLRTEFRPPAGLTAETRAEMYALFARAYAGTDRERFDSDLDAKHDVLLLRDDLDGVAGFTTLAVIDAVDGDHPVRIVFSGDTLVDPRHWGSNALNFAWIRHIAAIKRERPALPLYWLLISKGFRTYRYLSTFALHFVPSRTGGGDSALERLRDSVAGRLFGDDYDPERGVVAHDPPRDRLKAPLAALPDRGAAAEDARFFAEKNPGFRQGEELVCLCALEEGNMRPFARRLFRKALG
jgi:hypothetical protein